MADKKVVKRIAVKPISIKPRKEAPKKKIKGVEVKTVEPVRSQVLRAKRGNETNADVMFYYLVKQKELSISKIAELTGEKPEVIENWGLLLQKVGVVSVDYPTSVVLSPKIKLIKMPKIKKYLAVRGEKVEEYIVIADNVPSRVRIMKTRKPVKYYELKPAKIGEATYAIIDALIERISNNIEISSEEVSDPRKLILLKKRFFEQSKKDLIQTFPDSKPELINILAGMLVQRMYGLRDIEILMNDDNLEEIGINSASKPIALYHKKYGWLKSNMFLESEDEVYNYASSIGRKAGRNISVLNPIMDAHLITGDRVQSTIFPISTSGNTITIRKFARNPWTITQYMRTNTMSPEIGALLWLAVQYEMTMIIAGGTASGKTSCLNSISAFIPPNQRIISIEDTREISLPKNITWNWIPMTIREAQTGGEGKVTMLDLMIASLRMRPDRIIIGEVREKRQAETMFEAIHTGHSVLTTIHADSAEQAYARLTEEPIGIPVIQLEGVHLILTMFRDRRLGMRRMFQLCEIVPIPGEIGEREIKINLLYRWAPKDDVFEELQESERIFNDISRFTGLSEKEIKQDLKDKTKILEWMEKHDILDIDPFGKVINEYYNNPQLIIDMAYKNKNPRELL